MAGKKSHVYVFSTLAAAVCYRAFAQTGGDVPVPGEGVVIAGGSGVAKANLVTPQGVVTKITSDQLAICEADPVFQLHKKNGYITVSDHEVDPEVAAADMESRDASAQATEADLNADPNTKDGEVTTNTTTTTAPAKNNRRA